MKKIAVFGFTGYSGRNIAAEALRRGYDVIGVSRNRSGNDLEGVEAITGSIDDQALVTRIFSQSDAVIIAIHASADGKPFLIKVLPDLLSEAARTGKRLGFVGGAGSLLVAEGGPRLLDTTDPAAKNRFDSCAMSDVLDALISANTDADWFLVSPSQRYGAHAPGVPVGAYRLGGNVLLKSSAGISEISGPDLAMAMIDEIETPKHHRERFTVVAP